MDNTSRTFEENKSVKVYFERKNPNNVYIKPTLEILCQLTPFFNNLPAQFISWVPSIYHIIRNALKECSDRGDSSETKVNI